CLLRCLHSFPTRRSSDLIVFRKLMLYAAAILVISAFTFIIYRTNVSDNGHIEIQDLTPGTNRALITLSDGSVIELSEVQEGVILDRKSTRLNSSHVKISY